MGFARMNGRTVGIVANQPNSKAGEGVRGRGGGGGGGANPAARPPSFPFSHCTLNPTEFQCFGEKGEGLAAGANEHCSE